MPNKRQAHRIGTAPTGSPEWHRLRRGSITGSRVAAALGLSPWTSPFTLYWQLAGVVPDEVEETGPIEWGTRLEDAVIQKYQDNHPNVRVIRNPGLWRNNDRPWQVGTPDALLVMPSARARHSPNSLLEVKTAQYPDDWDDGPPVWYRCQVLHYLDVLGFESADVAVLFSGHDYREYTIWWDEQDAKLMREASAAMLRAVEEGDAPDIDGSGSTYRTIQLRNPAISTETIDVAEELVTALVDTRDVLDRVTDEYQQLISVLADDMGGAHKAFCNGQKVADRRAKTLESTPYVQLAPIKSIRKALQWEK